MDQVNIITLLFMHHPRDQDQYHRVLIRKLFTFSLGPWMTRWLVRAELTDTMSVCLSLRLVARGPINYYIIMLRYVGYDHSVVVRNTQLHPSTYPRACG